MTESATGCCLAELLAMSRASVLRALAHVELLGAAAPFCDPLAELIRLELVEAQTSVEAGAVLVRRLTADLAGPFSPEEWWRS